MIKRFFEGIYRLLEFLQFALVLFVFLMVFYWILEIVNVPFIVAFAPFFNSVKDFIHIFYDRVVVIQGASVDFSFVIFSFVLFAVVWALKQVKRFVEKVESVVEDAYSSIKRKEEELFNKELERQNVQRIKKQKKMLFLLRFSVLDVETQGTFEAKTQEEKNAFQKELMMNFAKRYVSKNIASKKVVEDYLLLYYDVFDDFDQIFSELTKYLTFFKTEARKDKWLLTYFIATDVYTEDAEVLEKYKKLRAMVKLNLKNDIVCTGEINQKYMLIENPKYVLECKGMYCLFKDSSNEEIFRLKRRV